MSSIEDDMMSNTIKQSAKNSINDTISQQDSAENNALEQHTPFIESLNLQNTAKQLEELKALIFSTPETNQTKIEFIKEELSSGRYQIHSDNIAAKLTEYTKSTKQTEAA